MRAVQSPRAAAVPAETAIPALVRALVALLAILALMLVSSPTIVRAQDTTATQTHTVKAGETLWSLAARYYGDGHKWHELSRLNGLGDNGEKGLSVGKLIKVPARKGAVAAGEQSKPPVTETAAQRAAAEKPAVEKRPAPEKAATEGGALASQTANKGDAPAKAPSKTAVKTAAKGAPAKGAKPAEAKAVAVAVDTSKGAASQQSRNEVNAEDIAPPHTQIWSVEIPAQRAARGKDVATVFQGHSYDRGETTSNGAPAVISDAVRPRVGEFEAAPFPLAASRFSAAAVVGRRVGAASAGSSRVVERLLLADEAEIQLPAGSAAVVGARYAAVTMGVELSSGVRLAVPTGVLQVIRAEAGKPAVARVARQSGIISQGEYLIPVEGAAAPGTTKATAVGGNAGGESRVLWVQDGALLPSLQSYLVLSAGTKEGITAGDEFWLVSKQGVGADAREQRIAVARVVRVTAAGSSAIVIHQDLPSIATGVAARRVAKAN